MKTILIPITNAFVGRTFLRTDARPLLEAAPDARLVFLVPPEKLSYYRSEFFSPKAVFDVLPEVRDTRVERFFKVLEASSIHSRTQDMLQRWEIARQDSRAAFTRGVPFFFLRRLCWYLGAYAWWRGVIRWCYILFSDREVTAAFDRHTPDMVFCPVMIGAEYAFLREARRRGIPTVGMILSWDNLFSKNLIRVHPDTLLVHTDVIGDAARRMGDMLASQIQAIGIPHYDRYFRRENNEYAPESRADFFKRIGADPEKKLILYAFSGKAGLDIELEIAQILHSALEKKEIREPAQVLIRSYPRSDFSEEKIAMFRERYGFLTAPSVAHVGVGSENWEFDEHSLAFLANSLAHADVVITMYSTFLIEAAIFDRPIIASAFDGKKARRYWDSAARFFVWDHLAAILPLGGIRLVKSKTEMTEAINDYLENPHKDREGRKKIVAQQCQYTDGKSGARLASILLKSLTRTSL
ncbi:MAG: CDP-glycerol glycerophosphotransferase family protein [Candidatus Sungiibacteriota bacterium]